MKQDILVLIKEHEASFSKSEKEVSSYLEKHPEQCALLSLSEFSENSGVSEATVIRFARKLGFSGFSDLKGLLKDRISSSFTISSRFSHVIKDDGKVMVDNFIADQIGYIQQVSKVIDTEEFSLFCKTIADAGTIYIYEDGGASMSPGNTLEFWLTRFGLDVCRLDHSGHRIFDRIVHHRDNDVIVSFCFSKDNPDLIKLLSYSKDEGITTLLITDCFDGAVLGMADQTLLLERGPLELFHSMSVPVLVAESISLFIAKMNGNASGEILRKLDDLRSMYDV